MQELTIEQLKFARSIGAVYCRLFNTAPYIDYYRDIDIGLNRYNYWGYSLSEWRSVSGKPIDWDKGFVFEIDFRLLDDYYSDKDADIRAQNAAAIEEGERYEKSETTHDVSHHKRKDGTDLIDEWWNKYEPEVARVLMWEMVNKYKDRLGKKDPVHIEVAKMADYMARWSEKELELIK